MSAIGDYFADRVAGMLAVHGRRAGAWGRGIFTDATAARRRMVVDVDDGWSPRGPHAGRATWQRLVAEYTAAGIDVVLSAPWYVVGQRGGGSQWPSFYAGNDPANFTGSATQKRRVLGGECTLWNDNTKLDAASDAHCPFL